MSQELAQIQYWLDRVSKLEKQVEHYKNKAEYLDKRELELLAEIKSLKEDNTDLAFRAVYAERTLHVIERHYDELETFSPSGNNAQDVGNTNTNLPNGNYRMNHDNVNNPKHYTSHPSGIDCIQITEHMGFCLGNAMKYIWRADLKGDAIEDLEKAVWYVKREIERRKREN